MNGQLIWLGMIYFIIYNFAYYFLGAAFNWFFPVYATLFVLGSFTFIFGMVEIDFEKIKSKINTVSFKLVIAYMFLWAFILVIAWIGQWVNFVLTGNLPDIMQQTGGSNNLVAALDLSLVVPVIIFSAIALWKNQPIGYVLSVVINVKGALYSAVLIGGTIIQSKMGIKGAMDLIYLWIFLFLGCLLSSIYLVRKPNNNRRPAPQELHP